MAQFGGQHWSVYTTGYHCLFKPLKRSLPWGIVLDPEPTRGAANCWSCDRLPHSPIIVDSWALRFSYNCGQPPLHDMFFRAKDDRQTLSYLSVDFFPRWGSSRWNNNVARIKSLERMISTSVVSWWDGLMSYSEEIFLGLFLVRYSALDIWTRSIHAQEIIDPRVSPCPIILYASP